MFAQFLPTRSTTIRLLELIWLLFEKYFLPTVQQRGKAVIDSRGASSATSAAKAALDTIIACEKPTEDGDSFSAAVSSDGAYDVPEGLICGYPLITLSDGSVEIKRDVSMSQFAKEKFQISIDEKSRNEYNYFLLSFIIDIDK